MKPFIRIGRFSINLQNVAYVDWRDDGSVRLYFVGGSDFLQIGLPEAEQLPPLLRDLTLAHVPPVEPLRPERLQAIGSRVEELQRSIEETARKVIPPDTR